MGDEEARDAALGVRFDPGGMRRRPGVLEGLGQTAAAAGEQRADEAVAALLLDPRRARR